MAIPNADQNHLFEYQISSYTHTENAYLVLSSATKDPFRAGYFRSISLGILISPHSVSKIPFLQDEAIPVRRVGVTCESCSILDCKERVAPPRNLERKERFIKTDNVVNQIMQKFK